MSRRYPVAARKSVAGILKRRGPVGLMAMMVGAFAASLLLKIT